MPTSRIPSPARSQGAATTPRRYKSRGSRSVGSPARSDVSGRLTSIIKMHKNNSFALSPMPSRRSVLADTTDIVEPKRRSWWRQLGENSRDVIEVIESNKVSTETNNIVEDLIEMEVLSQEKKSYNLDLPESSDNESIHSIIMPQRKLFKQKENEAQNKFGQLVGNRETLQKLHKTNAGHDKTVNVGPRELFNTNKQRNKPIFPAALLDISLNKTAADKSKEKIKEPPKNEVRNIFGNRAPTKRKNMFAEFVISESEDEIPEIQPKVFGFSKKSDQKSRANTISQGRRVSASSVTTDMEMDDWMMLPSSTMVAEQLEEAELGTPVKRARLSKLSEAKESETGTNSNATVDKTKQSNKSISSKNKSKNASSVKDKSRNNETELNRSMTTRNASRAMKDNSQLNTSRNESKYKSQKNKSMKDAINKNDTFEKSKQNTSKTKTSSIYKHVENAQNDNVNDIMEPKNMSESDGEVDGNEKNNFTLEYESDNQNEDALQDKNNRSAKNKTFTAVKRDSNLPQKSIHVNEKQDVSLKNTQLPKKTIIETEESQTLKEIELATTEVQHNQTRTSKIGQNISKHGVGNKQIEKEQDASKVEEKQSVVEEMNERDNAGQNESILEDQEESEAEEENYSEHEEQNESEKMQNESEEMQNESLEQNDSENMQNKSQQQSESEEMQNESQKQNENEEMQDESLQQNDSKEMQNESLQQNESEKMQHESQQQNENEEMQDESLHQNDSEEMQNESQEQNENEEMQNESLHQNESEEMQNESQEQNENEEMQNESLHPNDSEEMQTEIQEDQDESQEQSGSEEIENDRQEENQNESQEEEQNASEEIQNESDEEREKSQQPQNVSQENEVNESEVEDQDESHEEIQNESQENEENESDIEDQDESQEETQNESQDVEMNESDAEENDERDEEEVQNESVAEELNRSQEESADVIEKTETPNSSGIKSPEAILHDKTNQADSFTAQGRNTSVRKSKSMIRPLNIRPSLAPPRESTGLSDGARDSSAEGSGWDSHRTTRKTLRQTFGRDFTPRKSLRAMVMEKSAKRQTAYMDARSEITTLPQANSTEYPEMSNRDYDDDESMVPSDHELSRRTRQATLEMCLQEIKKKNLERRQKTEMEVKNLFKPSTKENNPFKVPARLMFASRRVTKSVQKKSKPNQINSLIPLDNLPPEMLDDMKYKPPKRFQPSNASWITKRLYKFLETKLEPKYDYKARVRAEKLVETVYHFTKELRRHDVAPTDAVEVLKHEMARLEIVKTHFEFYEFFNDFMPREIRVKVIPDIVNKISMPKHGIFSEIKI